MIEIGMHLAWTICISVIAMAFAISELGHKNCVPKDHKCLAEDDNDG